MSGPGGPGPAPPASPSGPPREPGGSLWGQAGRRTRWLLGCGLALTLAGLAIHARAYAFLTDDAFISFRYARNLSRGFGLVFNPGQERVEGYSNFLWVLLLAGFDRAGLAAERMALLLSAVSTLALWGTVAWFPFRRGIETRRHAWVALLPAALLALTRSVAVWSTSGLETRAFEALLVGGALRLVVELEADIAGRPRRQAAAWLFALASWTRPDGLLLSACALGTALVVRLRRGRFEARRFAAGLAPYVALVGGHFLWRRAYYGWWLPNTYYAKVGGRTWWDLGLEYMAAFALEYAVVLWLPLLALGVLHHLRGGRGYVVAIFGALVLPHALYVTAIGGDHFEYRPLDLYFPFLYLLLADGVREALARIRIPTAAMAGYLLLVGTGIWELAWQSHRQFPSRYLPGFPGLRMEQADAHRYLDAGQSWVYRWPGIRAVARLHRERLLSISRRFAGLRQEEHALFLSTVLPGGRVLRKAIDEGLIPTDLYVAMPCVGAIPYDSDLRTLDTLGLTDAEVAHSAPAAERVMAHDKQATFEYLRSRGVELWAVYVVHPVVHVASPAMLTAVQTAVNSSRSGIPHYAAALGDGYYLIGNLVQDLSSASARMPRLGFQQMGDPRFVARFLSEAIAAHRRRLDRRPGDHRSRLDLAYLLLLDRRFDEAAREYRRLARATPEDPDVWEFWAMSLEPLGDLAGARQALDRALALAGDLGDAERSGRLSAERERLDSAVRRSMR